MFFQQQISIANISVQLSTNDFSIYDYILKNYNKFNNNSKNKIQVQSFESIDKLQTFFYQKYKIKINIENRSIENIEMRVI